MTLLEQLQEAKTEYHLLMTGQKAKVYVDQNGERVEYNSTTAFRLQQYISSLEASINSTSSHPGALKGFF